MTASLVAALNDTITVEYSRIVLQDTNRMNSPLALMTTSEDWLVMGGPGGLLLHSAGSDHLPRFVLRSGAGNLRGPTNGTPLRLYSANCWQVCDLSR